MALRQILGANIVAARKELGWSQQDLASAIKTSRQYVGRTELGRTNVGIDTIARLAAALEKNPHELLKRTCAGT